MNSADVLRILFEEADYQEEDPFKPQHLYPNIGTYRFSRLDGILVDKFLLSSHSMKFVNFYIEKTKISIGLFPSENVNVPRTDGTEVRKMVEIDLILPGSIKQLKSLICEYS